MSESPMRFVTLDLNDPDVVTVAAIRGGKAMNIRFESRPMYWDRQGNPITDTLVWARLNTPEYKRVAETTIGPAWVSTVWIGLDLGFIHPGDPPLIFETMVFVHPNPVAPPNVQPQDVHPELAAWDEDCWRWATEAEAVAGHDKVCVDIRVLMEQIKMADEVTAEAVERAKGTT